MWTSKQDLISLMYKEFTKINEKNVIIGKHIHWRFLGENNNSSPINMRLSLGITKVCKSNQKYYVYLPDYQIML